MKRHFFLALSVAILSARMTGAHTDATDLDRLEHLVDTKDISGLHAFAKSRAHTLPDGPLADILAGLTPGFRDALNTRIAHQGRGPLPWADRPGKGRKDPPPRNPTIY